MLRSLSIKNVVLIERLALEFEGGLGVLTGETGSGKSILLDALGLACGNRADAGLVRSGEEQATVSAEFEGELSAPIAELLDEHGLEREEVLVLRRVLSADGRSRAFVNDQPVSVGLLRRLGENLVEVHGQMETHGLLDPANHRRLLDAFGGYSAELTGTAETYRAWRAAGQAREQAEMDLRRAKEDEEYLRHVVAELTDLDPREDEETALAGRRALLMHGERIIEAANGAVADLSDGRGVEGALRSALSAIERVAGKAEGALDDARAALERALNEAVDAASEIERASRAVVLDPAELERVEERLFALRSLARKHGCAVAELPAVRERLAGQLATVEEGSDALDRLRAEEDAARAEYEAAAEALSEKRRTAAGRLDRAVKKELPPLKLGDAAFSTGLEPLDPGDWGAAGRERVRFIVRTNPNTPAGPLHRIASGGELARLMLAIKVVLADADAVPTLIFDEVDAGIGGAAAAAVGERLARLAGDAQVLVVTHSPQVAARGTSHWRISKSGAREGNRTDVEGLGAEARTDEIARMLSGAKVTDEARAAALSLLAGDARAAE